MEWMVWVLVITFLFSGAGKFPKKRLAIVNDLSKSICNSYFLLVFVVVSLHFETVFCLFSESLVSWWAKSSSWIFTVLMFFCLEFNLNFVIKQEMRWWKFGIGDWQKTWDSATNSLDHFHKSDQTINDWMFEKSSSIWGGLVLDWIHWFRPNSIFFCL